MLCSCFFDRLIVPLTCRSKVLPLTFGLPPPYKAENTSILCSCFARRFGKLQTSLHFRSLNRTIETASRRYSRSEILKQVWYFPRLFVPLTCRSKVLTLGSKNKTLFILYFPRLIVPLRLRLEGTHVRKIANKFAFSLT